MARVFISYATADRAVALEVLEWMRLAGHEPFLDNDPRDGISLGEDWKRRLYRELREVDAVIGVTTESFVSSKWCFAELAIADAQGCRLIPLRIHAGVVHPLMEELQSVDYYSDPQQARDRVLQTVRLLEGGGGWREGDNPFPGLEPFTAARSQVFFGRAADARSVTNQLRKMISTGEGGMLAVVGPSGCGKSSLLNAAVAPLLDGDPAWLRVPTLVPRTDPLSELARALATAAGRLELDWSTSAVRGRLERQTDGLKQVADDLLAARLGTPQRRLLVVIDQAEELFTRTAPAALHQFTQLLRAAVGGPVQVVVVMRSEFLDDLYALFPLDEWHFAVYPSAPLGREMLREAIEGPAKVAKLRLDKGLVAKLVTDTGNGEALPLLAFVLRQLAEGLPPGGTLSLARYDDLGGVQGALTRHADEVLAEAVRVSGMAESEVLAGLTRLVTVDGTGRLARRRIKLLDLAEPMRVALRVFVEGRLLVSDTGDGEVWVTVVHEALLTGWRPLNAAINEKLAALRTARVVEQAAAEWHSAQKSEHFLWDDKRLTATQVTLGIAGNGSASSSSLVPIEGQARAFLDASARRVSAVRERERRRRTTTTAVLSTLLLLVTTASVFAFYQRNTAQTQRDTAIANQISIQADRLRSIDASLAAQLDIVAYRMRPTPDRYTALINDSNAVLSTPLAGHTGTDVVFSPDGRILASGSADGTVRLWDVADPAHPSSLGQPLTDHSGFVSSVVFSPDGRTLASGSNDDTVRLWDVADPAHPSPLGQPLTGHAEDVFSVVFSPDGRTLASGSNDDTVRLWNVADPAHPSPLGQPLTGHTATVFSVVFSPDGRTLASSSGDGTVRLWNVADPAHPSPLGQPLTDQSGFVSSMAFSPDGRILAGGSGDTVRLWNVADPAHPSPLDQPLTGHTNGVFSVVFSPDGRILASGSGDGTVRLWNMAEPLYPKPLGQPVTGHTGSVTAVAFSPGGRTLVSGDGSTVRLGSIPDTLLVGHTRYLRAVVFSPDGHTLASGSSDNAVRLWNMTDPAHPTPLGQPVAGRTGFVTSMVFGPDGRTLVSGSNDAAMWLWNVANPAHPTTLGQPLAEDTRNSSFSVVFSPDGHTLASSSDNTVRLWNVADPARPSPLGQPLTDHSGFVSSVVFSPDGRILASGSGDGTVRLWDVADPARPSPLGQPLTDHSDLVSSVVFSPDGRILASGSGDGTMRLWDVADPAHPSPLGQPLTGHTADVSSVVFSPDGHTLASGSRDHTVRLWDVADPAHPSPLGQPLTGHAEEVSSVVFSPDGHTLASGSNDTTVRLWGMSVEQAIQRICDLTTNALTPAKWELYFSSDVAYRLSCT